MSDMMHNEGGLTLIEGMIAIVILVIFALIAIPNFLSAQEESRQAEAKMNLGAIGVTAESWKMENGTYVVKALTDLGWNPQGSTRYSYWYEVGNKPVNFVRESSQYSNGSLLESGCDRSIPPKKVIVKATKNTFSAGAKGQIDEDPTCDEWSYNNTRTLNNPINDITQ